MLDRQNHVAGGANGSIMVGMFVCLCLASKKPSEREFLVSAGTDLGVKLLRVLCHIKKIIGSLSLSILFSPHSNSFPLNSNIADTNGQKIH